MAWGMITYQVPLAGYHTPDNGRPLAYATLASQKNYLSVAPAPLSSITPLGLRTTDAAAVLGDGVCRVALVNRDRSWQRDAGLEVGEKIQKAGGFPGAVALPWRCAGHHAGGFQLAEGLVDYSLRAPCGGSLSRGTTSWSETPSSPESGD